MDALIQLKVHPVEDFREDGVERHKVPKQDPGVQPWGTQAMQDREQSDSERIIH